MIKKYFILIPLSILLGVSLTTRSVPSSESINSSSKSLYSLQSEYNDGPYVIFRNDSIIELSIINGEIISNVLDPDSVETLFTNEPAFYKDVENLAVLSDVHGQYDLTVSILKNNGIIDEDLNWNYGTGHFVIVGDIFDRGDKVTELLWLVYKLEQQAEKAGGKLHFTLGNHEYMVMLNDLRYIHRKYRVTQQLLNIPYDQLYGKETLLGRWLRSKNTIIKINDYLFVHGGISPDFVENDFDIEQANKTMRESLNKQMTKAVRDSLYNDYYNSKGPIWYRGYFNDSLLKKGDVKRLLRKLDVKHVIVGHTSQEKIESLFKNKIFAVDTSIKNGKHGELLFIEDGKFYRGTMEGLKIPL